MISETQQTESTLDHLVDQVCQMIQSGERVDIESLATAYPEQAEQLRKLFATLVALTNLEDSHAQVPHLADDEPLFLRTLGDFRIMRQIGRGGMGVVYEAEQLTIHRKVALKILPLAALVDQRSLQRFKNEVAAIATLQHPNIVSVYSVGEERGIHYFAMQLIRGQSLAVIVQEMQTRFNNEGDLITGAAISKVVSDMNEQVLEAAGKEPEPPMPESSEFDPTTASDTKACGRSNTDATRITDPTYFRNVVRLIRQAADALQHAHENGIIHRDVKPGNLLLDSHGCLFVSDFGLARIESAPGMTMTGDVLGTLRYTSPEQVLAKGVVVDHRTDIYSLGATLYELLTLQPMWSGNNRAELTRKISFEEPLPLRGLNPAIPLDLETIVLKATSKNPDDRYQDARSCAFDLQCFLDHKPIQARRPTTIQRLAKWSRRNPATMWTLVLVSLILATGFGVGTLAISASRDNAELQRELTEEQRIEAEHQRRIAIDQRDAAQQNLYNVEMVLGQSQVEKANPGGLVAGLFKYLPLVGEPDLREWEWYYLLSRCRSEVRTITYPEFSPYAAWSPDGKYIGTPGAIWEAESGLCVRRFNMSHCLKYRVCWNPDGSKFAWGKSADDCAFYVWDRLSDNISRFAGHDGSVWCLTWSPDGTQIASGSTDRTIKIWDVASESVLWEWPGLANNVRSLAWSPDGALLAAGIAHNGIRVWELEGRTRVYERENEATDNLVAWHPSSQYLAVSEDDQWFRLARNQWTIEIEKQVSRCQALEFSPNGSQVAVGHGEAIEIWDSGGANLVTRLKGHEHPVNSLSWHVDGRRLVSCDRSGAIKIWDLDRVESASFDTQTEVNSIAWSKEAAYLEVETHDGTVTCWDPLTTNQKRRADGVVESPVAISNQGKLAAIHDKGKNSLRIQDTFTGENRSVIKFDADRQFQSVEFSSDASMIVLQTYTTHALVVEVWNVEREQRLWTWESKGMPGFPMQPLKLLKWNADDSYLAAVGRGDVGDNGRSYWSDHIYVFDVREGKRKQKYLLGHFKEQVQAVAWQGNGSLLAIGTADGRLEVLDTGNGQQLFSEKIDGQGISSIAWHPTGNRLAAGTAGGGLKIVNRQEGRVLLQFMPFQTEVAAIAWSEDGENLAAATSQGAMATWNSAIAHQITNGGRRGELAWAYYDRSRRAGAATFGDALREFVRFAPDDLGFWEYRGHAYAQLGQFDKAIDEFCKAVGPELRYSVQASHARALAYLASNRLDEFRTASAELVKTIEKNPVASEQALAVWLASLTSNPLVDTASLVEIARARAQSSDHTAQLILGLSLYRDGQIASANQILMELADKLDSDGDWRTDYQVACAKYFVSMCRYSLGSEFQAQRFLREANKSAKSFRDRAEPGEWQRVVILGALHQEATSKLNRLNNDPSLTN